MVHSVELLLDTDADAAVRRVWDGLAEAGVRSQSAHRSPTNRPHVTMTVSSGLSDQADDALTAVLDRLPLPCRLGAPTLFGRGPFTLVLLVVPSVELMDLHNEVHRICLPHMTSGPLPHAEPGQWTPHVTLARRMDADHLRDAMTVASATTPIVGEFVAIRHWDGDAHREHPIGMPGSTG
ncbi:2'-5' RNA ligase family protein [Mycolicibacterium diernhoferi]|uniref:2'-5' RNA ligase family protein n=1 Tax=Mycolicibacterium diernhoferi TaxID=1801 RepID=A0A1Q4HJE0_9MYCO|nr:2'-5' RNA ligase family protein [Mycolicibacterium diernhoferi]OJZ67613.1 hypothetical protein BRW64_04940 [Mycolicibacterium diernhoferi]OPE45056.1 hypothetical protein BV510_29365 [Mycolicibacterium diernhoferi]PEG55878.1 hypothetical protein CRI78_04505 [Mycolicibacterium diernhoferi]QYL25261.1 2'-5' RNA ligase family protein [Mycolicibacterium diernhoferi]